MRKGLGSSVAQAVAARDQPFDTIRMSHVKSRCLI